VTALILAHCVSACLAATTAAAARLTADQVFDLAQSAPLGQYLLGLRLTVRENAALRFDAAARRWTVDFLHNGRAAFRVVVYDTTGVIVSQAILAPDGGPAPSAGDAAAAVRASPLVGAWITRYPAAALEPEYDVRSHRWRVRVLLDGRLVADVWVDRGQVLTDRGPWFPKPGLWGTLDDLWLRLRPAFSFRQVAYLMTLVFLLLVLDGRRLFSARTLDALMLAAFVPAMFALRGEPSTRLIGYFTLILGTAWLTARLIYLAAVSGQRSAVSGPSGGAWRLPLLILFVAFAWQLVNAFEAERSASDYTGLIMGQKLFDTGAMPYGQPLEVLRDDDTYGPVHYLVYGLAERLFPTGVQWSDPALDAKRLLVNLTGAHVVAVLFHVLAIAAIIGISLRPKESDPIFGAAAHGRRPKNGVSPPDVSSLGSDPIFGPAGASSLQPGLRLAACYILLSVALGLFFTSSRVPPAALIAAGLWAFPNPYLAALCLGVATADMWFPIVLFPLWLGAFRGCARLKFLLAYAAVGLVFAATVLVGPGGPVQRARMVYDRVFSRQGTVMSDMRSQFWALLPASSKVPEIVRNGLSIAYFGLCLAAFWWPRKRLEAAGRRMGSDPLMSFPRGLTPFSGQRPEDAPSRRPKNGVSPPDVFSPGSDPIFGPAADVSPQTPDSNPSPSTSCLLAPGSWFLVPMSAALIAGTQLWKVAHSGEYMAWYLPVALLALFGRGPIFSCVSRPSVGQ
jgi:hypothetical protein